MGLLPKDWKWAADFLLAMLKWLRELRWLITEDTLPQGHRLVSFMELSLDFESHAGPPLPPTPQSRFVGTEMSLHEKGRVVRLAVTLLGRVAGKQSILVAPITTHCRSLVPLGAVRPLRSVCAQLHHPSAPRLGTVVLCGSPPAELSPHRGR